MNPLAIIGALRLDEPRPLPDSWSDAQWRAALAWCDRARLTVVLGARAGGGLPSWVGDRIARNRAANAVRAVRLDAAYAEIAAAFDARRVDHLVLKGFTQWPSYVPERDWRMQYDLDLFCPAPALGAARDALLSLAYEPLREFEDFPTDHLPVMVRKTGYRWAGDWFDPEIPVSIDLHFRFWDEPTERIATPGVEAFWERRTGRALRDTDQLAYAALHLLRHLLRGSTIPAHVHEIAWFLHHQSRESFWRSWQDQHPPALRAIQAVAFRLAREWFGCRLPDAAAAEVAALPPEVARWFAHYAFAPLALRTRKEEIWLHLALLGSPRGRWHVARRRLLPVRLPGPIDAVFVPQRQKTLAIRFVAAARQGRFLIGRAAHHGGVLGPALVEGARWMLGTELLRFLGAAALFTAGLFLILLLYNLWLLDLGFGEASLGRIAAGMTAGALVATLPAGWCLGRVGVRRVLLAAMPATALVFALRCAAWPEGVLIALAAAGGALLAFWQVATMPAVSSLVEPHRRATAFSFYLAAVIGVGVAAGITGGQLAQWAGKTPVMLLGCALCAIAALPLARVRFPAPLGDEPRIWPRSPFVTRYLAAIALWSLAVGAFNPFFNAYLAHLGLAVGAIGVAFSAGQAAQVAALLAAPALLRRFGMAGGIATAQASAAVLLLLLGLGPHGWLAASLYAGFVATQYMSEPGAFTLLMEGVEAQERAGASALSFFAVYTAQALAAWLAGAAVARHGYGPVLTAAGITALAAALLFWRLFRSRL